MERPHGLVNPPKPGQLIKDPYAATRGGCRHFDCNSMPVTDDPSARRTWRWKHERRPHLCRIDYCSQCRTLAAEKANKKEEEEKETERKTRFGALTTPAASSTSSSAPAAPRRAAPERAPGISPEHKKSKSRLPTARSTPFPQPLFVDDDDNDDDMDDAPATGRKSALPETSLTPLAVCKALGDVLDDEIHVSSPLRRDFLALVVEQLGGGDRVNQSELARLLDIHPRQVSRAAQSEALEHARDPNGVLMSKRSVKVEASGAPRLLESTLDLVNAFILAKSERTFRRDENGNRLELYYYNDLIENLYQEYVHFVVSQRRRRT